MSNLMEDDIKRWTAKRKTAPVLDIIQGKITISEASRSFDLPPPRLSSGSMKASATRTSCSASSSSRAGRFASVQWLHTSYPGAAVDGQAPDERRATDLCRMWAGRDGWLLWLW